MHMGTSSQILYILISASMGKLEVPPRLSTVSFNELLWVWNMFVVIFLNKTCDRWINLSIVAHVWQHNMYLVSRIVRSPLLLTVGLSHGLASFGACEAWNVHFMQVSWSWSFISVLNVSMHTVIYCVCCLSLPWRGAWWEFVDTTLWLTAPIHTKGAVFWL